MKRTSSGTMKVGSRGLTLSIPRSVSSPLTYKFKQSFVDNVILNTAAPPTGWTANGNGLVIQQIFNLTDISTYTRFTNLFSQYRILTAKTEMIFGNTVSDITDPAATSAGNRQLIVYTMPNRIGAAETLTEEAFLQTQSSTKSLALRTDGQSVTRVTPLSQLNSVFGNAVNTDYAKTSPRFISSAEPTTPHYGLDIRIQRVDGQDFSFGSASYPFVKLIHTLYFEMRQVQ